jgi:hypothetical protein
MSNLACFLPRNPGVLRASPTETGNGALSSFIRQIARANAPALLQRRRQIGSEKDSFPARAIVLSRAQIIPRRLARTIKAPSARTPTARNFFHCAASFLPHASASALLLHALVPPPLPLCQDVAAPPRVVRLPRRPGAAQRHVLRRAPCRREIAEREFDNPNKTWGEDDDR